MKRVWGIRVDEHVEAAGLDVSEHGIWGYPELYLSVPGGYGDPSTIPAMHRNRPEAPAVVHPELVVEPGAA
jgi:hypothetical protein